MNAEKRLWLTGDLCGHRVVAVFLALGFRWGSAAPDL